MKKGGTEVIKEQYSWLDGIQTTQPIRIPLKNRSTKQASGLATQQQPGTDIVVGYWICVEDIPINNQCW